MNSAGEYLETSHSKDDRSKDPSLMAVNYCCEKPAVREWQLNVWLKELDEKKVQVVVSLNSCYLGGAWRGDGFFRSPEDWIASPNLSADEAAATETSSKLNSCDAELEVSWGINLKGFTLMAACQSNRRASEKTQLVRRSHDGVDTGSQPTQSSPAPTGITIIY